jgi:hypothetical protein
MAAYRIPENRLIALSRGGTASWYRGVAGRYVEIFDHVPPSEYSARAGHGAGKPTAKIIEEAADVWAFLLRALGMEPGAPILRPLEE